MAASHAVLPVCSHTVKVGVVRPPRAQFRKGSLKSARSPSREGTTRVADSFDDHFLALTGWKPLGWQRRLFSGHFAKGDLPSAIDLPTGLGKTSVIVIWLLALAGRGAQG